MNKDAIDCEIDNLLLMAEICILKAQAKKSRKEIERSGTVADALTSRFDNIDAKLTLIKELTRSIDKTLNSREPTAVQVIRGE